MSTWDMDWERTDKSNFHGSLGRQVVINLNKLMFRLLNDWKRLVVGMVGQDGKYEREFLGACQGCCGGWEDSEFKVTFSSFRISSIMG